MSVFCADRLQKLDIFPKQPLVALVILGFALSTHSVETMTVGHGPELAVQQKKLNRATIDSTQPDVPAVTIRNDGAVLMPRVLQLLQERLVGGVNCSLPQLSRERAAMCQHQ
jgi:hypothetical protein